jgi:hypothetical protein
MARTAAAVFALGLVAASPAASWASGVELHFGAFFPHADSDLFFDDTALYTRAPTEPGPPFLRRNDWDGFSWGGEFSFSAGRHVEVGIGVDGYTRELDTAYRDFTRPDGSDIHQTLRLEYVPVGLSLRFLPLNRFAPVQPYLTVGGDAIFYQYEEFGDFIDFFSPNLDISSDHFKSDGTAWGGHVAAGIRVPVGHDFAFTAEGKYLFANKPRMEEDFRNNHIDVSGWSVTGGIRLRF